MPAKGKPWAVVVAAGAGSRLGGELPKALVPVSGKPMFLHSVERFLELPDGFGVAVTAPADRLEDFHRALKSVDVRDRVTVAAGGETRSASVRNGLEATQAGNDAVVLIHDAARPLASGELIARVLNGVRRRGNATPVVPLADTVKEVSGDRLLRTLPREGLYAVQTPQGFRKGELLELLHQFPGPHQDDAVPFELAGREAFLVEGERLNIKITYPEDLRLAETLLATV